LVFVDPEIIEEDFYDFFELLKLNEAPSKLVSLRTGCYEKVSVLIV